MHFAFLQNKTLSGVGMDSVVEPLDVSIEDFCTYIIAFCELKETLKCGCI